jgi:hypothetical protein
VKPTTREMVAALAVAPAKKKQQRRRKEARTLMTIVLEDLPGGYGEKGERGAGSFRNRSASRELDRRERLPVASPP